MSPSPAERYAISREQRRKPRLVDFASRLRFDLDPFQRAACAALDEGSSVLVAAPTGAGKTVVAEFAVFLAMQEQGDKVFYTTPIKALSNQKYQELVDEWGAAEVGLLTGDTNVNSGARIVVMTTEVLRNMLYADSPLLDRLAFVVMDEVHYLADRFRGAVWEEVIIHLPEEVRLVSLSATVSNAEEFGDWLQAVRGDTDVIVSEDRPVPLEQHVLVKAKLLDLFDSSGQAATNRVNPELQRLARSGGRSISSRSARGRRGGDRGRYHQPSQGSGRVERPEVIELLHGKHLLPAIVFVFSRVGCDQAVRQVLRSGIRLTDTAERDEIRADRRGARADAARRGPRGARLLGVARGPPARRRGAPRGHAARVQGDRRGALPAEAAQGRVRDRDARARREHAGAVRGAREAREVQRRGAGADHAGGVHAAHRARRTTRHRRRGALGHPVGRRPRPRGGRRARLAPQLPAQLELQAHVQHGGEPRRPVRP